MDCNIEAKGKEHYDGEREKVSCTINRLSSGNEVIQGQYSSDNYDVTDTEANGDNAKLDSKSSQRESNKTQNNASGSKHQEWSEIKGNVIIGRNARLRLNLII